MELRNLTSLARPLEFDHPSNRTIALLTLVVLLVGAFWQVLSGASLWDGGGWAAQAALAVLLAWALGRELDPDRNGTAFIAAGFALGLLWLGPLPSLLPVFWCLLWVRVVNRSVGPDPTPLDWITLLGLTGWLALTQSWLYGPIASLGVYRDHVLSGRPVRGKVLTALALALSGAAFGLNRQPESPDLDFPQLWPAFAVALLFVIGASLTLTKTSLADATATPLDARRVLAAQSQAAATGLLFALFHGTDGVFAWTPLWAVMAAGAGSLLWVKLKAH